MKTVLVIAVTLLVPVTGHWWGWFRNSRHKPRPTPASRPTPGPTHNCSLPLDKGQPFCAQSPQKRFFFNTLTEECESFQFYPCGGNSNNFKDLSWCQLTCERRQSSRSGVTTKGTTVTVQTIKMNNGNATRSTKATMASGNTTRGGTVPPPS